MSINIIIIMYVFVIMDLKMEIQIHGESFLERRYIH